MTHDAFLAQSPVRQRSPEWDFGVMWRGDDGRSWPQYRVSWIVETGEVYAVRLDHTREVEVLGVVPKVGEYPYGIGIEPWGRFKEAQTVERVLDGWADGEPHKTLAWVRARLQLRNFDETPAETWRGHVGR